MCRTNYGIFTAINPNENSPEKHPAKREMEFDRVNGGEVLVLLPLQAGIYAAEDNRIFECKTCNRRFPSFQALGGHRASHKRPRLSGKDDRRQPVEAVVPPKPRVHECSVCGVEFPIGQALGGHMRRHRNVSGHVASSPCSDKRAALPSDLDLNLPPSSVDVDFLSISLRLGFVPLLINSPTFV